MAILRHLGRQHGYYNHDDLNESFYVDWAIETQLDFWGNRDYMLWLT